MKTLILLTTIFIITLPSNVLANKKYKKLPPNQIKDVFVRFDPNCLRIPGAKLPIGITTVLKNGDVTETRGFLDGETRWRNFKIRTEGGYFLNGNLFLSNIDKPLKGKGITVFVFNRKTKQLIKEQFIPFNFEVDIKLLTKTGFKKAPGQSIDIGFKKTYNNQMSSYAWPRNNTQALNEFTIYADGAFLKNGNILIHPDPFKINNHKIKVKAIYKNNQSLSDSIEVTLDYRANYHYFSSGSNGFSGFWGSSGSSGSSSCNGSNGQDGKNGDHGSNGPDLEVYADAYFDTIINEELLFVEVTQLGRVSKKSYFINVDGGSIRICSDGGDGGNGGDGGDGGSGGNGKDGEKHSKTIHVNDSTTKTIEWQDPGKAGGHGGDGGYAGNGGDGGHGGYITIYYTQYAQQYLHLIQATSRGGDGGDGGDGGNGGSGGNGGNGSPDGPDGSDGRPGNDGFDGYDGNPGKITLVLVEQ